MDTRPRPSVNKVWKHALQLWNNVNNVNNVISHKENVLGVDASANVRRARNASATRESHRPSE